MDFMPQANWQWVYNEEQTELMVQMGDQFIEIAFKSNMLVPFSESVIPFTIEDVANYSLLFEKLRSEYDSPQLTCQTVLHILAFELFHKPVMSKSWLFQSAEMPVKEPEKGHTVSLQSKDLNETESYLVLENSEQFIICMLLGEQHKLTTRKILKQFQIVKVTADKLSVLSNKISGHCY